VMPNLTSTSVLSSTVEVEQPYTTQAARAGHGTRSLSQWVIRWCLRGLLLLQRLALLIARCVGPRPRPLRPGQKCTVLLTGTFYSENWINAHVQPLAASRRCRKVYVVSTFPIPPTPGVVAICPPDWLRRLVGDVPARLLTFAGSALALRPHLIGGFHLLVNGLLAAPLARLVGARSLYFCVGGPTEVLDGGIWAENRLFGRQKAPNPAIERQLIAAVNDFDLVVTMGRRAADFFRQRGVGARFRVVSGGIDSARFATREGSMGLRPVFRTADAPPATSAQATMFDLILVGRLAPIKRIDLFLRAVEQVSRSLPDLTAAIVGDGALRAELEELVEELGIGERVHFAGQQSDVEDWLKRSRIFVLTSDSEGLALSLMEAMMCGLPAVVSDVGELGELVASGTNGCLVRRRTPEAFAAPIIELLNDPAKYDAHAAAARQAAMRHDLSRVRTKWDRILTETLETN